MKFKDNNLLCVANYDSNVGYAWKLIESFWLKLADLNTASGGKNYLIYPSISILPEEIQKSSFTIRKINFSSENIIDFINLIKFIRSEKIKTIYLTDQPTTSIKYILLRLSGVKKIIVHDHTPGTRKQLSTLKRIAKKITSQLGILTCDAAFAVSPFIAQRLKEINCLSSQKIHCVTNGIVAGDFSPRTQRTNKEIKIVSVSRMTKYKGISFSLEVIAELINKKNYKNIKYIVIGDGPDIDLFKKQAIELKIDSFVTFAGKSNNVSKSLQDCDIAFHPSYGEALSIAILEYMRAALPCLISSNPSVNSVLEHMHTALIYREHDLQDAANKLETLIANPDLALALGNNAQLIQREKYTEEKMFEALCNAYKKVIEQ